MTRSGTKERRNELLLIFAFWTLSDIVFWVPYIIQSGGLTPDRAISIPLVYILGLAGAYSLFPIVRRANQTNVIKALVFLTPVVAFFGLSVSYLDLVIFDAVGAALDQPKDDRVLLRLVSSFSAFFSQYAIVAAIIWSLDATRARRARETELASTRIAAAEAANAANLARLSALRYQLNPHFLFNTLNSISSLVVTKRNTEGEEMLERLSEFLRMTLGDQSGQRDTLEKELETIEAYLSIERVRFGDCLETRINVPAELRDAAMPPFLLQPLVENSVKYGMAADDGPMVLSIDASRDGDDLVVVVEDDGRSLGSQQKGAGIGLRNISERLTVLFGTRARLETAKRENGFLAVVRLPLELPGQTESSL